MTGEALGALYPLVRAILERGVTLDERAILVSADRTVTAVRRVIAPFSVGEDVRVRRETESTAWTQLELHERP